jgi:hypothetical protein
MTKAKNITPTIKWSVILSSNFDGSSSFSEFKLIIVETTPIVKKSIMINMIK